MNHPFTMSQTFHTLRNGAPQVRVFIGPLLVGGALMWSMVAFAQTSEPIQPIPLEHKQDPAKAQVGRQLFNDKRLSKDNTVACASCHNLPKGGADGLRQSLGVGGSKGAVNSPTIFNSAFNFRQFWDGRANSLEAQIDGPIHDPREMATNWADVVKKLSADAQFSKEFKAAYPSGVNEANIKNALATFQRTQNTPNARFDKFLRGEKTAITTDELKGYQLFKSYGCVACHQGVNVGGNMFQTFGVMGDYFKERGNMTDADLGRYNVTKKDADRHAFKVPSLRNVAMTAPYFHDGSVATLEDAVNVMFKYQLGRTAPEQDKALIVKFLHTLTGEMDGKPLTPSKTASAQ